MLSRNLLTLMWLPSLCEKQRKIIVYSVALHFPIIPLNPAIPHPEPSESINTPIFFLQVGFWTHSRIIAKSAHLLWYVVYSASLFVPLSVRLPIRSSISLCVCLSVWLHISA